MSELLSCVDQAWTDHATDAAAVATRLPALAQAVANEAEWLAVGRLTHHVLGEHLAAWAQGAQALKALAQHPCFNPQGSSGLALRRWLGSLSLAAGQGDARAGMAPSDAITVTAQAATALALHDLARATQLLTEALAAAESSALRDDDPAVRALAIAGNNLAATLEEQPQRSDAARALMLQAAQAGRRYWARAGTWLETERAEYRLAMSWLAAGDAAMAKQHALACLAIVDAQTSPPALERFFGFEVLALAERAAGETAAQTAAVQVMQLIFASLPAEDQGWCQPSLTALTS